MWAPPPGIQRRRDTHQPTKWRAHVVVEPSNTGQRNYQVRVNVASKRQKSEETKRQVSQFAQHLNKLETLRKIDRTAHQEFNGSVNALTRRACLDDRLINTCSNNIMPRRPNTTSGRQQRKGFRRRQQQQQRPRPRPCPRSRSRPSTASARSRSRPLPSPVSQRNLRNSGSFRRTQLNSVLVGVGWQYIDHCPESFDPMNLATPYCPESFDLGTLWGRECFLAAYMKTVSRKICNQFLHDSTTCRVLHSAGTIVACIKDLWQSVVSASSDPHVRNQNRRQVLLGPLEGCPEIELLMARTMSQRNSQGVKEALEQCDLIKLKRELLHVENHLLFLNPRTSLNTVHNSWVVEPCSNSSNSADRRRRRIENRAGVPQQSPAARRQQPPRIMSDAKRILDEGGGRCVSSCRRSVERLLKIDDVSNFRLHVWALITYHNNQVVLRAFDVPYCTGVSYATFVPKQRFCTVVQLCDVLLRQSATSKDTAEKMFQAQIWTQITAALRLALQNPNVDGAQRSFSLHDFTFLIDSNLQLWLESVDSKPDIFIPSRSSLVTQLAGAAVQTLAGTCCASQTFPQFPQPEDTTCMGTWREIAKQDILDPVKEDSWGFVDIEYQWRSRLASVAIQKIARGYLNRKK